MFCVGNVIHLSLVIVLKLELWLSSPMVQVDKMWTAFTCSQTFKLQLEGLKGGNSIILNTGFESFFRNKFPGLFQDFFQDSGLFLKGSKIHTFNPYTLKISMLILLTASNTLHIFQLRLTDFQNFSGPVAFFQHFPVLKNAIIKFQDFPGFPGLARTLLTLTFLGSVT